MIKKTSGEFDLNKFTFYEFGRKTMPVVGRLGIQQFVSSFQTSGGQTDASLGGWKKRKVPQTHPILVKTFRLFRNVKIRSQRHNKVVFGTTGVPYARFHNDGTDRLPKREFIGDSEKLFAKIDKVIYRNLKKML